MADIRGVPTRAGGQPFGSIVGLTLPTRILRGGGVMRGEREDVSDAHLCKSMQAVRATASEMGRVGGGGGGHM